MREVEVVGVRVELPTNQPLVLLHEVGGERLLPIWIGAVEASAIANAIQGLTPPRPMTHDLLCSVIGALGDELAAVQITEVREGVFHATLRFTSGVRVEARPSDAIALALRIGATLWCAEQVLDQAGIALVADDDAEVERFREFLDEIEPEDFR